MEKAIYIHGLGGSGNGSSAKNVRKMLEGEYEFSASTYDLLKPEEAFEQIQKDAQEADLVVASSLGAFYVSGVNTKAKVVLINPCLKPQEIIEGILYEDQLAQFDKEKCINGWNKVQSNWNPEDKASHSNITGVFAYEDELFHFKDYFDENFAPESGENSFMIHGKHEVAKNLEQLKAALTVAGCLK